MTIQNPQLVNILVLVMAALIIVQALILVLISFRLAKQVQHFDQSLRLLSQRSAQGVAFAKRVIAAVEKMTPRLSEVEKTVEKELTTFLKASEKADQAAGRSIDLLRFELGKANSGLDTLLSKFSQKTFEVHRAAVHPSKRVSELIRASLKILKQTLSREKKSPASYGPEKETFI